MSFTGSFTFQFIHLSDLFDFLREKVFPLRNNGNIFSILTMEVKYVVNAHINYIEMPLNGNYNFFNSRNYVISL